MIKLQRGKKPAYLTAEKVKELTEKFKNDNAKAVWKNEEIGSTLLKSSSYKCAYCECQLQEEDSYMQIEHFKDKDTYPDDVVNWDNLLPSCGRCNRKKWTLDVIKNPIINPYIDNPKDYLEQQAFRLYGKDAKGKLTIAKLYLNDERVVKPRFFVANEIGQQLSDLINESNNHQLRNGITKVLQSCQADKPYSAILASTLHSNPDYQELRDRLIKNNLWDTDLMELHQNSIDIALDSR